MLDYPRPTPDQRPRAMAPVPTVSCLEAARLSGVRVYEDPPRPPGPPASGDEIVAILRAEGGTLEPDLRAAVAQRCLREGLPPAAVRRAIENAKAIRGFCGIARRPDLAERFIALGSHPRQVGDLLTEQTALVDLARPINTTLTPDQMVGKGARR